LPPSAHRRRPALPAHGVTASPAQSLSTFLSLVCATKLFFSFFLLRVIVGAEIMPGSIASLNLPKMETCPSIKEDAYHADKRSIFLRFKKSTKQMMAHLDLTINTTPYPGTWALIYDDAARKALQAGYASYPAPTNPARKRVYKHTQLFLHDLLMRTFQDLCPTVTSKYEDPEKYNDLALQDANGHP
jgi:hypothetical protein